MPPPLKVRDEEWKLIPVGFGRWKVEIVSLGLPSEIISEDDLIKILKTRGLSESVIQKALEECLGDGTLVAEGEVLSQGLSEMLMAKITLALKMLAPVVAMGDWRVMNAINILQHKMEKMKGR